MTAPPRTNAGVSDSAKEPFTILEVPPVVRAPLDQSYHCPGGSQIAFSLMLWDCPGAGEATKARGKADWGGESDKYSFVLDHKAQCGPHQWRSQQGDYESGCDALHRSYRPM